MLKAFAELLALSCLMLSLFAVEVPGKVRAIIFVQGACSKHQLGIMNIIFASGNSVGASLGGYLADTIGWRW